VPINTREWLRISGFVIAMSGIKPLHAHCFDEAAQRFGVSAVLLRAIATQESGGKASALNKNPDGSWDMGLMQINSRWLPTLTRHGISADQLWDPCINVHIGAWVLAGNFRRMGHTWEAVGAYNAVSPDKRRRYAQHIQRHLQRQIASQSRAD
jgi:soluble lytic murein transglycosylase-like protein